VHGFNAQMNSIPKMDKFAKKCIVVGGIAKVCGRRFFEVPKAFL
jgi:hypothetical protein